MSKEEIKSKKEEPKRKIFEIEQQLRYLKDGMEGLQIIAEEDVTVKDYAMILHDKDDGKVPHVHLLVRMKNSYPYSTIAKKFNVPVQQVQKIKKTFGHALLYLTHDTTKAKEEGKAQYDDSKVISNFAWQLERDRAKVKEEQTISDWAVIGLIATGVMRPCEIVDEISWEQQVRIGKTRLNYAAEIAMKRQGNDCNQKTILIHGLSGTGKTTLAKRLAAEEGQGRPYIAGDSKDIWEYYAGERIAILDDFRGENVSFTEFLRLCDEYTTTPIHSRYYDKTPMLDLLIITTTREPEDFYKSFAGSYGEDLAQIRRRIWRVIELREGEMTISEDGRITEYNFDLEALIAGKEYMSPK